MYSRKRAIGTKAQVYGVFFAVAAAGIFSATSIYRAMAVLNRPRYAASRSTPCKGKSESKTTAGHKGRDACKGRGLLFPTKEDYCHRPANPERLPRS